jgi:hypothetical protein
MLRLKAKVEIILKFKFHSKVLKLNFYFNIMPKISG